ncbi:unnamed protein product [Meganyctiphanes norvegica]|uniref:ADP-ribosyl cyclase/cyclic ADP-ribose hydrolase n=1 Tax=Meganyctiphanes norvegica TaxID=48144 RepID=A0AAV2RFM4_MEGNR
MVSGAPVSPSLHPPSPHRRPTSPAALRDKWSIPSAAGGGQVTGLPDVMQKRRRVSDSVIAGVLPALGLGKGGMVQATGGHLGNTTSTFTTPLPWAVINLDIFWVMLSPNSECTSCGAKASGCGGRHMCTQLPPTSTTGAHTCCQGNQDSTTDNTSGNCCNAPCGPCKSQSQVRLPQGRRLSIADKPQKDSTSQRKMGTGTDPGIENINDSPENKIPCTCNIENNKNINNIINNNNNNNNIITNNNNSNSSGVAVPCYGCCGCPRAPLACPETIQEDEDAQSEDGRPIRAGDGPTREGGGPPPAAPPAAPKGPGAAAAMKLAGEAFKNAVVAAAEIHRPGTPTGDHPARPKSGLTIKTKGICTRQSSINASQNNLSIPGFEDLELLGTNSQPNDIQSAIMRYSGVMSTFVDQLRQMHMSDGLKDGPSLLNNIDNMIRKAWSVPTYGHELGFSLCNVLRNNGGLDLLINNCQSNDFDLKFNSAKVLEQCLTTENRGYVIEKGLETVVSVACDCTKNNTSVDASRIGTGILEHLFKHNEGTCSDIIKLGGLDAVLYECRKNDIGTLRNCAGALANLSLYGGSENQQAMIERNVPMWLFPLAFHPDDNIKYYALLTIAALVANKEIEAAVMQSGSLDLVEPFLTNQSPERFATSSNAHRHGQSGSWLKKLVPVLHSKREEARNLAAFHFAMEAGIKAKQENVDLFHEIEAIEPLKEVASSPNAIASKYAAQALRLIGEEVPHKLSQQVPVWTPEDVKEWVKQIGFKDHADIFADSLVDGDLLLKLNDKNLQEDLGITNGILRQRFQRDIRKLKLIADYSSCDHTSLNSFITQLDSEFSEYTYQMIQAGVTKDLLRYLTDEQLRDECGISNSIHRQKIRELIIKDVQLPEESMDKNLDVFISYRRSNGSQLASLLKVHLQLRGFSVFIDVERLEAGKFDNNLLNSIRQAKNFLLVLTPSSLERCLNDHECKDWVHREIVAALQSGCNIIPIIDNFQWPEPEELPEDMRAVCYFNGVRWIHDYQDACVDKLDRFMRGEVSMRSEGGLGRITNPGTPSALVRSPPIFQRTASTESGKGSSCSDNKD